MSKQKRKLDLEKCSSSVKKQKKTINETALPIGLKTFFSVKQQKAAATSASAMGQQIAQWAVNSGDTFV